MRLITLIPAILGSAATGAVLIRDSLSWKTNFSYLAHIQFNQFIPAEPNNPPLSKNLTCIPGTKPLREYGAIAINFWNKPSQWYKYDDTCFPEDLLLDNYPLDTTGYSSTAALKEFEITNLNLGGGGVENTFMVNKNNHWPREI